MPVQQIGEATIITGEDDIKRAVMLTQRRALELETFTPLRHSRGSMTRNIRTWYRLTGTKYQVFVKFAKLVEERTGVPYRPAVTGAKAYFLNNPL